MRQGFTLIELMIVIAIIAIIAAIAIPNLMESRVTANEAAASASLKSGVFPGEVQFQSGGYQDVDADNVGEYGTLRALAGISATSKIASNSIHLLQGPLATSGSWTAGTGTATGTGTVVGSVPTTTMAATPALGTASGYKFCAYVPGDTDSTDVTTMMIVEGNAMPTANAANMVSNNGEKYWAAFCAPDKFGDTGRRIFMICNDGQIRSPAQAAAINLAFKGAVATVATNGSPLTGANAVLAWGYCLNSGNTTGIAMTSLDSMNQSAMAAVYAK